MLQSNWRWISWRTAWLPLVLAILCLSVPYVGHAQVTATLTGTVQDSTGGVIPNAKVTLTNEATQEGRTETTNEPASMRSRRWYLVFTTSRHPQRALRPR